MLLNKTTQKILIWTIGLLGLTGAAQMPIFKRYYIADIPGLGWLANFYLTHRLHYVLATILLFIFGIIVVRAVSQKILAQISGFGWFKLGLWLGIIVTGMLRVIKNYPQYYLSPKTVVLIDIAHLGLVITLGLVSLIGWITKLNYLKKS